MKINNSDGLSLTELLIASVIIGIMMTGIGVFIVSVKQMEGSSERTMYTNMKLTALMKAIRKDAELANGDPTNPGILIYNDTVNDVHSICFRQDLNYTPDTYLDDTWACWFAQKRLGAGIFRCYDYSVPVPPTMNFPPQTEEDCNWAAENRDYFALDDPTFFEYVADVDGRMKYLTITLTAHDTNKPAHPVKNPDVTITTKINPPGMSH